MMDLNTVQAGRPLPGIAVTYRDPSDIGTFFKVWDAGNAVLTFTAAIASNGREHRGEKVANAKGQLKEIFGHFPREVRHLIDRVPEEAIYVNEVCDYDLVEECSRGPVVLVGDAAHSMCPALGQGGNVALEDACELACALKSVLATDDSRDISETLQRFCKGTDRTRPTNTCCLQGTDTEKEASAMFTQ
jgi:2-polyprenyl-6-methoxyphenol hydroxylase-like FAD-dependent oxidoreductase